MGDLELTLLRGFQKESKEELETLKAEIAKVNNRLNELEERIRKLGDRTQNRLRVNVL